MEIICVQCKRPYEYTFGISQSRGHRKTRCSSCWQKRKRLRRKEQCLAYKGGKCERCGYSKCIRALEFHHRNPQEKNFEIGDFITNSWDKVKAELDKCQLLCSNCHAEVEDSLVGSSNGEDTRPINVESVFDSQADYQILLSVAWECSGAL